MSDLIMFAALFATFAYSGSNYAGGPTGRDLFDLRHAFIETLCLLFSSPTYGLAMLAMPGDKEAALVGSAVTFLFGLGFIALELHEFHGLIAPGAGPERSAFLSAFFTLVGPMAPMSPSGWSGCW